MHAPFGRIPLFLDLGENAFGFVVDAVCAGWELAIALDLLFAAHIAGLGSRAAESGRIVSRGFCEKDARRETHPSDAPPLGIVGVIEEGVGVAKHVRRHVGRQMLDGDAVVAPKDLGRLVEQRRPGHSGHLEAAGIEMDVVHGGQMGAGSQTNARLSR
jgi:hypothetical protein